MKRIHPEDPRVTAHALGELPKHEAAEVERAALANPAVQAAMDEGWCLHGDGLAPPFNCWNVASHVAAQVAAFVDGSEVGRTPTLQLNSLPWVFDFVLPPGARFLKFVAVRSGALVAGAPAVPSDAYDYVNLVGGFLPSTQPLLTV